MRKLQHSLVAVVLLLSLLLSGCSQSVSEPEVSPSPTIEIIDYSKNVYTLNIVSNGEYTIESVTAGYATLFNGSTMHFNPDGTKKFTITYYYIADRDCDEYFLGQHIKYNKGDKRYSSVERTLYCQYFKDGQGVIQCDGGTVYITLYEGNPIIPTPSPSPSPKITYRCFVTATGSCYHNHKCGNMNMNKVIYMTVEEAKQAGYVACSKCY